MQAGGAQLLYNASHYMVIATTAFIQRLPALFAY